MSCLLGRYLEFWCWILIFDMKNLNDKLIILIFNNLLWRISEREFRNINVKIIVEI